MTLGDFSWGGPWAGLARFSTIEQLEFSAPTMAEGTVWVLVLTSGPIQGVFAGTIGPGGTIIGPCVLFPPAGGAGGFNMQASPPGFQPPLALQQGGIFTGTPIDNPTPPAP